MTKTEIEFQLDHLKDFATKAQKEALDIVISSLEQEPCDAISREKVLEIFKDVHPLDYNANAYKTKIENLPPVYPKAKVGKWVTWSEEKNFDGYTEYRTRCKCSECNTEYDGYFTHFIKYCSNCGAKMEEVEE